MLQLFVIWVVQYAAHT